MPERPTANDVIVQEGRDVLRQDGGKYVLMTYIEGENTFSDQLVVDYLYTGGKRCIHTAQYRHCPDGMADSDFDGQAGKAALLARVDITHYGYVVNIKAQPALAGYDIARFFHQLPYYIPGTYSKGDYCFQFLADEVGGYNLSGIDLALPEFQPDLFFDKRKCLLQCYDGKYIQFWDEKGEFGGWFTASFTLHDVLALPVFQGKMDVNIPIARTRTRFMTEKFVITTEPKDEYNKLLTVFREEGQQSATLVINLPLTLDAITAPPDFSNPESVYGKMQEIQQLLLGLKPQVTSGTVATTQLVS